MPDQRPTEQGVGGNANTPSGAASASSRGKTGASDAVPLSREPDSLPSGDLHIESEKREEFCREVARVINRLSLEGFSNTPDFLLAEFLWACLLAYSDTVADRDEHRR